MPSITENAACDMFSFVSFVLLLVSLAIQAAARYQLAQDYSGINFYRGFDFFTDSDPTRGHVKYKSMVDANATGIAGFIRGANATNAIYMGVDTNEIAPQGRGSVRVTSKQAFTHFLMIADIVHMPGGICGTWPAFWTVGQNVSSTTLPISDLLMCTSGLTAAKSISSKVSTTSRPTT